MAAEEATWASHSVFTEHIAHESVSPLLPFSLDANRWHIKRCWYSLTNTDNNHSVLTCCCGLAAFPGCLSALFASPVQSNRLISV